MVKEVLKMPTRGNMRVRHAAASFAISALAFSAASPAWSQAVENTVLSSSLSERFEGGEFGEPLGEARPRSAAQAALVNNPQPQYVYYVVPCGTPGAIRAGSPDALVPETLESGAPESGAAQDVCVALVDENQRARAPLLYSYDSSYRYPSGYPNHHRSSYYSGKYSSSINVGYYSSRRYGAYGRHGLYPFGGHYGRYPFGGHYAGFPYRGFPYGGHYGGYPYGGFPYGGHYSSYPYVSHHYSVGFGVGYSSRGHYRSGRYARGRHASGRFGSHYSHMHHAPLR